MIVERIPDFQNPTELYLFMIHNLQSNFRLLKKLQSKQDLTKQDSMKKPIMIFKMHLIINMIIFTLRLFQQNGNLNKIKREYGILRKSKNSRL